MPQAQSCDYLVSLLTAVQAHVKVMFNDFINTETAWITAYSSSAKRAGVLSPFLKFPAFAERIEQTVRGVRSQAADTSYQKLCAALFKWLDTIALQEPKYSDVVWLENYHFFYMTFKDQGGKVPSMSQAIEKAHAKYKDSMLRYVNWNISYELEDVVKFWDKLEDQLRARAPEDIPFTEGLEKSDLRVITGQKLSLKAVTKSIEGMCKRIIKHMPKNGRLVCDVWDQLADVLLTRFERFEKLMEECYPTEKMIITGTVLENILLQLRDTLIADHTKKARGE